MGLSPTPLKNLKIKILKIIIKYFILLYQNSKITKFMEVEIKLSLVAFIRIR